MKCDGMNERIKFSIRFESSEKMDPLYRGFVISSKTGLKYDPIIVE